MDDIKLMTVTHKTVNTRKRAQIILKGEWLELLGFSHEMIVTCSYEADALTLQAQGKGMAIYKKIVEQVRKNKQHLCQVLEQQRHYKKEPYLIIDGIWLSRLGFKSGDVILCSAKPSLIEIKRINLECLGFKNLECTTVAAETKAAAINNADEKNETTYKLIQVQKSSHHGKVVGMIQLKGAWLLDVGFYTQQSVLVTYENNGITFHACRGKKLVNTTGGRPPHINMHYERSKQNKLNEQNNQTVIPFFQLKGRWILDDYDLGDYLVLQIKHGVIQLRSLAENS